MAALPIQVSRLLRQAAGDFLERDFRAVAQAFALMPIQVVDMLLERWGFFQCVAQVQADAQKAGRGGTMAPARPQFCFTKGTVEINTTTPAHDETGDGAEVSNCSRARSGRIQATKIDAPVYSPPTEKPCVTFAQQQSIGAQMPMEA